MMKWENPKIHNLDLKETKGAVSDCPKCKGDDSSKGVVNCYYCDCCTAEFHQKTPNHQGNGDGFYDNAYEAYMTHIRDEHNGQCS